MITDDELLSIIDEELGFEKMPPLLLFNIRLLLHEDEPAVDLEKDLEELCQYPERLLTSHHHEWSSFCKRRLFKVCKQACFVTRSQAEKYLNELKRSAEQYGDLNPEARDTIIETTRLLNATNVRIFESPASRRIRQLIG